MGWEKDPITGEWVNVPDDTSSEDSPYTLVGYDPDSGQPLFLDTNTGQIKWYQAPSGGTPLAGGGGAMVGGNPGGLQAAPASVVQSAFGQQGSTGPTGSWVSVTDANGNVKFYNPTTGQTQDPGINVGEAEPPWFVQRGLQQQDIAGERAFQIQQSQQLQQFQAYQAELDRAATAEFRAQQLELARRQEQRADAQFLFQIEQYRAQQQAQQLRDRVAAAGELARTIGMADPLAQQAFSENIQGALAGGQTGLSENAIEPAAQIYTTLTGNPIDQARQKILELRQNTQLPTLFSNAASGDDLGLQNVKLATTAPDVAQSFVNALQSKTGVSTSTYANEAQRRRLPGVNRRRIALTA